MQPLAPLPFSATRSRNGKRAGLVVDLLGFVRSRVGPMQGMTNCWSHQQWWAADSSDVIYFIPDRIHRGGPQALANAYIKNAQFT
jgi:hypothetical protein